MFSGALYRLLLDVKGVNMPLFQPLGEEKGIVAVAHGEVHRHPVPRDQLGDELLGHI